MPPDWKTLCELNGTPVLQRNTETGELHAPYNLDGIAHYFEASGTPEDVYPRLYRRARFEYARLRGMVFEAERRLHNHLFFEQAPQRAECENVKAQLREALNQTPDKIRPTPPNGSEPAYPRRNRNLDLLQAVRTAKEEMEAALFWVPSASEGAEGLKGTIDYLEEVLDETRRTVKPHTPEPSEQEAMCPVHGPYYVEDGCRGCEEERIGPNP